MATKSSSKKSAPKKAVAKPKVVAKKAVAKKANPVNAKKAKPPVKAAAKKKAPIKKVVPKPIKKIAPSASKAQPKKVNKVVNKKQNKPLAVKGKAVKPTKKVVLKTLVIKNKPAAITLKSKKDNTKVVVVTKTAPVSNKPAPKTAKSVSKNDAPLKPVTKPILKKSASDAAASQRNMAIRAKYKKVEIEYPVHSAKHILFSYLSTSSGLSEWFADKVNEKGDIMVFEWDGAQQAAKVLSAREDHHIRFRWLDMPEAIYFEFRVETDEITGDLALIITDFCEDESGVESAKNLWNSQIDNLFHVLGIH